MTVTCFSILDMYVFYFYVFIVSHFICSVDCVSYVFNLAYVTKLQYPFR